MIFKQICYDLPYVVPYVVWRPNKAYVGGKCEDHLLAKCSLCCSLLFFFGGNMLRNILGTHWVVKKTPWELGGTTLGTPKIQKTL
jgi:hypothetical protein